MASLPRIPMKNNILTAHFLMLLSQAFFAGNYVFFRAFSGSVQDSDLYGNTTASVFSLLRGILSLGLIPILYFTSDDKRVPNLFKQASTIRKAVITQGLAGAIRQNVVPFGLMFTSAASAGVVQPFVPIGTCIVSLILGLETTNIYKNLSMLLGGIGVFIAARGYDFAGVDKGFLILLAVPVTKAAQVTGQKVALASMNTLGVQIYQILCLFSFTVPFVLTIMNFDFSRLYAEIVELPLVGWGSVLYSVIFIIFLSWKIQLFAVSLLGPIAVGLYQVTQPIFCFVFAYYFLGEEVQTHQLIGAIFVAIGLLIFAYGNYKKRSTKVGLHKSLLNNEHASLDRKNSIGLKYASAISDA